MIFGEGIIAADTESLKVRCIWSSCFQSPVESQNWQPGSPLSFSPGVASRISPLIQLWSPRRLSSWFDALSRVPVDLQLSFTIAAAAVAKPDLYPWAGYGCWINILDRHSCHGCYSFCRPWWPRTIIIHCRSPVCSWPCRSCLGNGHRSQPTEMWKLEGGSLQLWVVGCLQNRLEDFAGECPYNLQSITSVESPVSHGEKSLL